MNNKMTCTACDDRVTIENHFVSIGSERIRNIIQRGLSQRPKKISSMFFYDSRGSKLFEEITKLEEYYLSGIEKELISRLFIDQGRDIVNANIVELGSGDCSKISILLRSLPGTIRNSIRYSPVDISRSAIEESAETLVSRFPGVTVHGVVADFINQLSCIPGDNKRIFCFFGSTIGNFERHEAMRFMNSLGTIMQQGEELVLGLDMVKDVDVLERAYNDKRNITALFNKNILRVVNNQCKTDFNDDNFTHLAYYNTEQERIEMYLVSSEYQMVRSPFFVNAIEIAEGEMIHTENSHKFTGQDIELLAAAAGLEIKKILTDRKNWFSLVRLVKRKAR